MDALAVKCPTCQQAKNVECMRLSQGPGYRVQWVRVDPHPAREAKAHV